MAAGQGDIKGGQYRPGVCNIGHDERRKRRQIGVVGFGLALVAVVTMLIASLPPEFSLVAGVFYFMGATGFLQARFGFCVYYGVAGEFNLGSIDRDPRTVNDASARAQDRWRAIQLVAYALVFALALTAATYGLLALL
ncbi:MAG: hypothetical protein ABEI31_10785 [Halodesulfurarchaeum sp.]